tara:strand:+ start:801 stop:1016 length:216 start_codon:yes stop_codon:yes gene_type:complete
MNPNNMPKNKFKPITLIRNLTTDVRPKSPLTVVDESAEKKKEKLLKKWVNSMTTDESGKQLSYYEMRCRHG